MLLATSGSFLKNLFAMLSNSIRLSSDMTQFQKLLSKARNVLILTGAGMSAESGVPTFRGEGGFWRNYRSQDLATLYAFHDNPGLVWEFYHYRRELVRSKTPNSGHIALSSAEKRFNDAERSFTIITQNVDGLHTRAGSKNVIELHGNLFKTQCTICSDIREDHNSPVCEALAGRGQPEFDPDLHTNIPEHKLPRCHKSCNSDSKPCKGLLRPNIVWFGERLDQDILRRADIALTSADVCLVVGTSAVVYPAAGFAETVASRGVPVAEVNLEPTPATQTLQFHFSGKSGEILPELFNSLQLM